MTANGEGVSVERKSNIAGGFDLQSKKSRSQHGAESGVGMGGGLKGTHPLRTPRPASLARLAIALLPPPPSFFFSIPPINLPGLPTAGEAVSLGLRLNPQDKGSDAPSGELWAVGGIGWPEEGIPIGWGARCEGAVIDSPSKSVKERAEGEIVKC